MKITKSYLQQVIKEELEKIYETDPGLVGKGYVQGSPSRGYETPGTTGGMQRQIGIQDNPSGVGHIRGRPFTASLDATTDNSQEIKGENSKYITQGRYVLTFGGTKDKMEYYNIQKCAGCPVIGHIWKYRLERMGFSIPSF